MYTAFSTINIDFEAWRRKKSGKIVEIYDSIRGSLQ